MLSKGLWGPGSLSPMCKPQTVRNLQMPASTHLQDLVLHGEQGDPCQGAVRRAFVYQVGKSAAADHWQRLPIPSAVNSFSCRGGGLLVTVGKGAWGVVWQQGASQVFNSSDSLACIVDSMLGSSRRVVVTTRNQLSPSG